jgi:hypothetical protein
MVEAGDWENFSRLRKNKVIDKEQPHHESVIARDLVMQPCVLSQPTTWKALILYF